METSGEAPPPVCPPPVPYLEMQGRALSAGTSPRNKIGGGRSPEGGVVSSVEDPARSVGKIPRSVLSAESQELRKLLRQDMDDCLRGLVVEEVQALRRDMRERRGWKAASPRDGAVGASHSPRGQQLPPSPNASRGAAHALGGQEAEAVMGALQAHGLLLEEVLRRLPPARGAGVPRASSSSGAGGGEKPAEPNLTDGTGGEGQQPNLMDSTGGEGHRLDGLEGPDCRGPESSTGSKWPVVTNRLRAVLRAVKPKKAEVESPFHKYRKSAVIGSRNRVRKAIQRLVMSPAFDLFFGFLILVNTIVMVVEEQYSGAREGYDLGFYTFYGSDHWTGTTYNQSRFRNVEAVFAGIFTIEVIMRMVGMGGTFFRQPSEWFDLIVVILSDLGAIFSLNEALEDIQLLRLLRTAKMLRLLKLVRQIEGFDSLHLMMTALYSSLWALLWSILLLLTIQTFIAMIATNTFRSAYLQKGDVPDDVKDDVFKYFGTYTRAMLSLFELALANWPPICRWLMEDLHEGFMVAALSFKLVMGFAVIGVINAVFMQETFKVANTDDVIMVRLKMRAARLHKDKMEALFDEADADASGRIQRDEFRTILGHTGIKMWLASMGLAASDADTVFNLLKGDDDAIDVNELINGISHLQGAARSIDMLKLLEKLEPNDRMGDHAVGDDGGASVSLGAGAIDTV